MKVHDRFFVGRVVNSENADLIVFKYHLVMLWIDFDGILRQRGRTRETHEHQQKQ